MSRKKKSKVEGFPIGTELRLVIPRTVRKNRSHRAVPTRRNEKFSATMLLSEDSREFRAYVRELCKEQGLTTKIEHGAWGVEIVAYWPTMRHLDMDFPYGDVDAPITPVLDALQKGAQLIDDDVRLRPLVADGEYDSDNPRIEVTLKRWA